MNEQDPPRRPGPSGGEVDDGAGTFGLGVGPDADQLLKAMAVGVYGTDRAGLCTFVNKAALALLRFDSEADLVGRSMHDVIRHAHPAGSTHLDPEGLLPRTFRTGASVFSKR